VLAYAPRMALIACPECKREISSGADGCPHCGRTKPRSKWGVVALVLVLAVAAIAGGAYYIDQAMEAKRGAF
jgi:RNA polymerase subunit RPABC4/transcription elongation factor Spt4